MRIRDVCRHVVHGSVTLVQLAVRGELQASHVWVGVRGAGRYVRAVADGDVAGAELVERRLGEQGCGGCPSRSTTDESGYAAHWCGRPLVEGRDAHGATCGCLLQAKASVASEACPRGRW